MTPPAVRLHVQHDWTYSHDRRRRACYKCRRAEAYVPSGDYWWGSATMSLSYFLSGL